MDSVIPAAVASLMQEQYPFMNVVSPDPWSPDNGNIDVAEINLASQQTIFALINKKISEPHTPLAGLVLGSTGNGKTHFLRRIRRNVESQQKSLLFCSVPPLFDPKQPLLHLLQAIGRDLSCRLEKAELGQFGILLNKILLDTVEKNQKEIIKNNSAQNVQKLEPEEAKKHNEKVLTKWKETPGKIFESKYIEQIQKQTLDYLTQKYITIHKNTLKVFFQFTDKEKRQIVQEWMRGNVLEEGSYKTLGIAAQTEISLNETTERLLTLCRLFEAAGYTLILCFDQLDDMYDEEEIRGFGKMINFVVNQTTSVLPLVFVRQDTWDNRFSTQLDGAVIQRIASVQTSLTGCTESQAKQLIEQRISNTFGNIPETPLIQKIILDRITFVGNETPREVIQKAQRIWEMMIWETMSTETKNEITTSNDNVRTDKNMVAEEYKKTCEQMRQEFDTAYLPNDESVYLRKAAQLYLQSCGQPDAVKLFVNMKKTDYSRIKFLKEGIAFLQREPNRKTVYLTDARCGLTETRNVKLRNEFETLGGTVLVLEKEWAVRWYALAVLSTQLSDIPAEPEDLMMFLQSPDFDAAAGGFDKLFDKLGTKTIELPPPKKVKVNEKDSINSRTNSAANPKNLVTLTGVHVRSKSEIIVANTLTYLGLSYEYEKPLGNFLPDFTIQYCGQTFYWEHLGLLSQPEYQQSWQEKERWYHDNGIDVITSQDDNGGIDSQKIEAMIRQRILRNVKTTHVVQNHGNEEEQQARQYMDIVLKRLAADKLSVKDGGYIIGPRIIRLKLLPDNTSIAQIKRKAEDLQVAGLPKIPVISGQTGYVAVDVPRLQPATALTVQSLIRNGQAERPKSVCAVPLGATIEGKTYWLDLADTNSPHILIGGTTGSGKSVLLQSLVQGLQAANPNVAMEFTLIDPKMVTFTQFPLNEYDKLITDTAESLKQLEELDRKMNARYSLFEPEGIQNITEYNESNSAEKLPHHFIIIDEFADFTAGSNKKDKDTFNKIVRLIAAKGRAAGIHLILATQRPDTTVINAQIRNNLPLKIALKVNKSTESKLLLDEDGAENLLGRGDMLLGNGTRLQGAVPKPMS
jgi:ABC-type phosphate/phosphonate transport system ATPase subunit